MTVQDIIDWFSTNPNSILIYFSIVFIISLLGLLFIKPESFKSPLTYLYTFLIYAITIPALLALILLLYGLFIQKTSFLEVNAMVYFLPIVAWGVIIVIIKKTVPLVDIPGFDRLSGLIVLIVIAFIITYVLQRMFFGVIFMANFTHLIGLFLILLLLLRYAWKKIAK